MYEKQEKKIVEKWGKNAEKTMKKHIPGESDDEGVFVVIEFFSEIQMQFKIFI
jgi:hypothetical protein